MFAELNNFIKKRTTAKSRDLTSAFRSEKHFNPLIKTMVGLCIYCLLTEE